MGRRLLLWLGLATLAACGGAGKRMAPASETPAPIPFNQLVIVEAGPLAGMHFEHFGVNPTIEAAEQPRSMFSLQAEDASLTLSERIMQAGRLPPPAAVRVEDFINALPIAAPNTPPSPADFSLDAEAFPSPNRPGYHVLRLSLHARAVPAAPRRIVAVIDAAQSDGLLAAVRQGMAPADQLAVVAADGRILQPLGAGASPVPLAGARRSTSAAGLQAAYQLAAQAGQGQIFYLTDGLAHLDAQAFEQCLRAASAGSRLGVELVVVAQPGRNFDDARGVRLAQAGAGRYAIVSSAGPGSLSPLLARDAQASIAFNPQRVVRYRLMGHESLGATGTTGAHVPAGSSRTILYELKLRPGVGPLGTVQIDYLDPRRVRQRFVDMVPGSVVHSSLEAASIDGRQALIAAALAEKLRGAYWVRQVSYDQIRAQLDALPPRLRSARIDRLLSAAARLDRRSDPWPQHPVGAMGFDHVPVVQR